MRKKIVWIVVFVCYSVMLNAQIGVDKTNRYLITKEDGKPFFWLADTGWELFRRLTREEAVEYLETRKKQQFNVIMAVALAEEDGLRQANVYGKLPFRDLEIPEWDVTPGSNPGNINEYDYWDHVDFIVREAAKRNLYIGLLPTWGDKVAYKWGAGPMIFHNHPEKAYAYAKKLAERYKDQWNIIWILGGDRPAVYEREGRKHDDRPVWRTMAKAIREVCGEDVFITYHTGWPPTSDFFPDEEWLGMHTLQSGHGSREVKAWELIRSGLNVQPQRPIIDLEPCYEDHPVNPWDGKWTRAERGYFNDYDVRARIYRGVFAGGCGATYGHHQVWQFLDTTRYAPINAGDTIIGWKEALNSKAANQIYHLKNLMLSRKDFNRVEDNNLVVSIRGSDYTDEIIATRNKQATYAMVYLPKPEPVTIDLDRLSKGRKKISWFNPVTGKFNKLRKQYANGILTFTPPSVKQKDWVLVIDVK